ncbi:MAG: VWA domain-containing protein [Nocardioidaceae bacterium]|nr:MAG: VWA domain-containing protein [Nocardioidaceae bacterium]
MVGFSQALRRAGVTAPRTEDFAKALEALDPLRREDIYWAGRATLCCTPDDLVIYERLFQAWFTGSLVSGAAPNESIVTISPGGMGDDGQADGEDPEEVAMIASAVELLRNRNVADLNGIETQMLARMFETLRIRLPMRKVRRRQHHHRGRIDVAAMVREQLRRGGEPANLRFQRRRVKPRRVVLLLDVSGSMAPYADHLLRLAHRFNQAAPNRVEVFTIGTRLTRVTRAMRFRDSTRSLSATAEAIPDWSGGTRLGEVLEAFVDRWGRRGPARGAVVVITSDGWERGDPGLLADQMRQLRRLARSVIWVNPHRGKVGFQPVQAGMAAALPYIDQLVAGHTFATFEELVDVVAAQ